jgi:hypothetical protein
LLRLTLQRTLSLSVLPGTMLVSTFWGSFLNEKYPL